MHFAWTKHWGLLSKQRTTPSQPSQPQTGSLCVGHWPPVHHLSNAGADLQYNETGNIPHKIRGQSKRHRVCVPCLPLHSPFSCASQQHASVFVEQSLAEQCVRAGTWVGRSLRKRVAQSLGWIIACRVPDLPIRPRPSWSYHIISSVRMMITNDPSASFHLPPISVAGCPCV